MPGTSFILHQDSPEGVAYRRQLEYELSIATDRLHSATQPEDGTDLDVVTNAHRDAGRLLDELAGLAPDENGDFRVQLDPATARRRLERALEFAMTDADHTSVARAELRDRLRVADWALDHLDSIEPEAVTA